MNEFENEIFSYLISQVGILSGMMKKYPSLGTRTIDWLIGKKPILIIGGEPGSGKSLFMGELILRYYDLAELQHRGHFQFPPALISYDRVHYLFLKRLRKLETSDANRFLPEGETHPEVRKLITEILWDTLLFAIYRLPKNTPIILEVPLLEYRGESLIDKLLKRKFPIQVFILHSPVMQSHILQQEKQQVTREISASPTAIRQIHEALLKQRKITSSSTQTQNSELIKSWEQWLGEREGLILSWNPIDDKTGFAHIKDTLKERLIPSDPLIPEILNEYATLRIESMLETTPNLDTFATRVQMYHRQRSI